MTGLEPLILLWAWSQSAKSGRSAGTPAWPTAASPPPRLPAFQPQVPSADTGTPLAELHAAAPHTVTPVHKSAAIPTSAAAAKRAATSAAKKGAKRGLSSLLHHAKAAITPGSPTENVAVSTVQQIVNAHGGKLKRDGLYGPATARAWSALAKQKGVPTAISRVGPKMARVVMSAYDTLSVPPIP